MHTLRIPRNLCNPSGEVRALATANAVERWVCRYFIQQIWLGAVGSYRQQRSIHRFYTSGGPCRVFHAYWEHASPPHLNRTFSHTMQTLGSRFYNKAPFTCPFTCPTNSRPAQYFHRYLKGLSHEIDFKNFDKNLQNLALLREAAGFWIF